MVYLAKELLPKLTHLTLCGINFEGELEWIGTKEDWNEAEMYEIALTDK